MRESESVTVRCILDILSLADGTQDHIVIQLNSLSVYQIQEFTNGSILVVCLEIDLDAPLHQKIGQFHFSTSLWVGGR